MRREVEQINKEAYPPWNSGSAGKGLGSLSGAESATVPFGTWWRVYFRGNSFQNMPAESRGGLMLVIDGDLHPWLNSTSPRFTSRWPTRRRGGLPPGDPYEIEGLERALTKKAVNIMFECRQRIKAIPRHHGRTP